MDEATVEDGVPTTAGWFVISARDARWMHNDMRAVCKFGEPAAVRHGAGVPDAQTSARDHYPTFGTPQPGPPPPFFDGSAGG